MTNAAVGATSPGEVRGRRSSLGATGRDRAMSQVPAGLAIDQLQAVLTEEQAGPEGSVQLAKAPILGDPLLKMQEEGGDVANAESVRGRAGRRRGLRARSLARARAHSLAPARSRASLSARSDG